MLFNSARYLLIGFVVVIALIANAAADTINVASPLASRQAFSLTATMHDSQTVVLSWKIADGYYLYKDRFHIVSKNKSDLKLAPVLWPDAKWHQDKILGRYAVYGGNLSLPIPIISSTSNTIELLVYYQGCSSSGFCYAPQGRRVLLNKNKLNVAGEVTAVVVPDSIRTMSFPVTQKTYMAGESSQSTISKTVLALQGVNSNYLKNILLTHNSFWAGLIFLGLGFLLSLTPCVLPMIPILLGILAGGVKVNSSWRRFNLALFYVLGMAFSYALIGLLFGGVGENIQLWMQQPAVLVFMGLLFIFLAISLFGFFNLSLPAALQSKLQSITTSENRGSIWSALLIGIVASLVASPCVTPPLVAVLAFISHQGSAWWGAYILFMMGLGMGVPLLIIGVFGSKYMPRSGPWMVVVKNIIAFLLIAVALWFWQRLFPAALIAFLWGGWCLLVAISLLFSCKKYRFSLWSKFLMLSIAIVFLMFSAWCFWNSWSKEGFFYSKVNPGNMVINNKVIDVKNLAALNQELVLAKDKQQAVFVDFYASWCVACQLFARDVLGQEKVKKLLSRFVVLHVDVTENNSQDRDIMQYFSVIAPPTFIFYNKYGVRLKDDRIVGGDISPGNFAKVLAKVLLNIDKK